jgi:asparagine synthase (glutamine-hydrolysing)
MCGIAGVLGPSDGIDTGALLAALVHRGPDRTRAATPSPGIWLGSTRLSINDLSPAGDMPMVTADGALTVVHNGEIYNAPALRDHLVARGHVFRSRSDTEVLLHGYREWGDDVLSHLEGMFAFALWDAPRRRLLLGRDPLGIKPLWLCRRGGRLAFASEVRALVRGGVVPPSLSLDAVGSYLASGSVAEPHAIVRGVEALPPGHRLAVDADAAGGIPYRYWAPPDGEQEVAEPEALARVRARLEVAIVGCLEADVPVGVLLSGGIDSSVVALIAGARRPIETFHVFTGGLGAGRAARLARSLGTKHHEIHVGDHEAEGALADSLAAQDQPSIDGANTFLVAGAIRQAGLKAAVSGLGADELFLGYPMHRTYIRARRLQANMRQIAAPIRQAAALAARVAARPACAPWQAEKAFDLAAADGAGATYLAARALFPATTATRLCPDARRPPAPAYHGAPMPAAEISRLELGGYLLHTLLHDADVMSMAHGVELRVPLLDHRLVETVLGLPGRLKLKDGRKKPLLVDAVPELPDDLERASKEGFDLPFESWLNGRMRPSVEAALAAADSAARVGIEPRAAAHVWRRFLRHRDRPSAYRAWALYSLFDWARAHRASV